MLLPILCPKIVACSVTQILWGIDDKSADPLFRFVRRGKAGFIDSRGAIAVQPILSEEDTRFAAFHEGLLAIRSDQGFDYIDRSGKVVLRVKARMAFEFSEGRAAVSEGDSFRAKYGFVDRAGRVVISPQYSEVGSFSEGLAVASKSPGETGYIDRQGDWAIQPRFSDASAFHQGLARVILRGPCRIVNGGSCERAEFAPLLANADYDCRFAFIDKNGGAISELRFDDARDFSEGLAAVRVGRKWGFIDKAGLFSIPPAFDSAESFSQGLAVARRDALTGFIDPSGRFAIAPQFDYASGFSDGRAIVSERDRRGTTWYRFIDRSGEPAFPGRFAHAGSFVHGLAPVVINVKFANDRVQGRFAWIDVSGKTVFAYDVR